MKYKVLYIPGLGDHYDTGRSCALHLWRIYGVEVELIPIKWYAGGAYEDKLTLVKQKIAFAEKQGLKVVLVGESAGASLALNAAVLSDVDKVVLIAGVNSSRLSISPHIQRRSPSFTASWKAVSKSLESINPAKIHTIRALVDSTVSPRFNDIPGAKNHIFFTFGHIVTVLLCLTVLSPFVMRIIRSK